MTKIAIIGTGALGARHLQALARLEATVLVELVDPVPSARERAIALLAEVGGIKGEVRQYAAISELESPPDVAIVVTNARDRLPAVQQLCELGCPSLILEKVLFTRREDYLQATEVIEKAGANVWVNCARRTSPRFSRLQELIAGRPVSYRVAGGDWGLACNAIHHLDEWMLLHQAQKPLLSGVFEPEMIPASRDGYFEVFGTLCGSAGTNTFEAVSRRDQKAWIGGDREITIRCEDTEIVIGQMTHDMLIRRGGEMIARESYPVAMQSEATAWHVATILAGGEPSLPRYDESAQLHLALLDVLMPHFQFLDPSLTECPIT